MPLKKKKSSNAEEVSMEVEKNKDTNSSSGSDDSDEDTDVYSGNEEIQVDFEGRNPIDIDFHGIRQLLNQLFLKAHINLSELTDLIIAQNYIGSVVTQTNISDEENDDDDDDEMTDSNMIFGITTAINICHKSDVGCIKQIRSYLLEKAEKYATDSTLTLLRDTLTHPSKHVGFLINERFVNIPPQISVPLLESLYKEIRRANDKKMPYKFIYFLMMIKFHRKLAKKNKPIEDIYSNAEEEIMCENAVSSFEYSVKNEIDSGVTGDCLDSGSNVIPYRKVILIDADKLPDIIGSIKQLIGQ